MFYSHQAKAVSMILLIGVAFFITLPSDWKRWTPNMLQKARLHLGLDLAGGTQLDFRISEEEIDRQLKNIQEEITAREAQGGVAVDSSNLRTQQQVLLEQKRNIVEAIRTVLERRMNALGVSETTITPSYVGNEKHLLAECPGIIDSDTCIDTVGKTIQLEFKEEHTEPTEEFHAQVEEQLETALRRVTESGETLAMLGQDLGDNIGIFYQKERTFFQDELADALNPLWNLTPRSGVRRIEGIIMEESINADGQPVQQEIPGMFLAEVTRARTQTGRLVNDAPTAFSILEKQQGNSTYRLHEHVPLTENMNVSLRTTLQNMQPGQLKIVRVDDNTSHLLFLRQFIHPEDIVDVSHILIAYTDALSAEPSVIRTKADAFQKIQQLKTQLDEGANFANMARQESDGPSRMKEGYLGRMTRSEMVQNFARVAFNLQPGIISDPVETPFGFHLLRVNEPATTTEPVISYDELIIRGSDAEERGNTLIAQMQAGDITKMEDQIRLQYLFFSFVPSGWKDTLLDGKHFRTASVTVNPTTNVPVVEIQFDSEGAKLFQELTRKNIGKSIAIFVGGQLISAPIVQEEISGGTAIITGSQNFEQARFLAQDLNTGAIPAPIHLTGIHTVEPSLGARALETSIIAGLIGFAALALYMFLVYGLLGIVANIALFFYIILLFALMKLPLFFFSDQYIVLTLAGIAGIILSTGMAIDANILIFERLKEEIRKGKFLKTAIEISFKRSWSAIWDSNFTTLLTCSILFFIGTSIIRGFAITLGLGILLSMFTAITVTRWMLRWLVHQFPILNEHPERIFGIRHS